MGVYRKIRFLSIEAEISTLDDFLALFMNRQIILSQKMGKKIFHRKQLATLSQRSPVKWNLTNLKNEKILGILTKYLMYEILLIDVNYV